jgi:hypothetical protein
VASTLIKPFLARAARRFGRINELWLIALSKAGAC